jgi:hypothetical protein
MKHGIWLCVGALAVLPSLMMGTSMAAEATFDKTISVHGPVLLSVNTGSGFIHVSPGSDSQVHIVGHVRSGNGGGWLFGGSDGGSPEDRVKQVVAHPPIEQAGNIISIGKNMSIKNVSIDYEITTPRGTDLSANSGSGDIRIHDEGGPVRAKTGSGSIEATGLSAHVSLETGSGDIRGEMLSAMDVKAQTGSGSIELKNVQSSLWAETGSGDLKISGKPVAPWKLETGSGSVTLDTNGGHFALDASTGSGTVHSDPPISAHGSFEKHHVTGDVNGGGPQVRVVTGSGDVTIH